jgi:hypothetical protein
LLPQRQLVDDSQPAPVAGREHVAEAPGERRAVELAGVAAVAVAEDDVVHAASVTNTRS